MRACSLSLGSSSIAPIQGSLSLCGLDGVGGGGCRCCEGILEGEWALERRNSLTRLSVVRDGLACGQLVIIQCRRVLMLSLAVEYQ